MQIKAIFFDIDGTLVDSNDLHVKAWQEAFAAAAVSLDPATIHAQIGKGTDMLVPTLLPKASDDLIEKLGTAHEEIFKRRYLDQVRAFPKARDLLARTRESGKEAVLASSASKAELDYYLAFLNVKSIVSGTTCINDVKNSKPAPDIFGAALKKVAPLLPDEVLVVGDAPYDAEAAHKCGIATVSLRSGGFPDATLRNAGAIAIYDDVAALFAGFETSPLAG